MDWPLIASAALLGLAGIPHCAAMCSAPCAAAMGHGSGSTLLVFQAARILSYATAGALVASGMAALAALAQSVAVLRPLWTLLHVAALALGLVLLWRGRQPAWMARGVWQAKAQPLVWVAASTGSRTSSHTSSHTSSRTSGHTSGRTSWVGRAPARGAVAGSLWVFWPCGLLQSALLLAALTSGPSSGAAAMATFALASSAGLWWAPWLRQRGRRVSGRANPTAVNPQWQERWVRLGGLMLVLASSWALGHGLWPRVAAWCGLA